jgi:hypothetical protein
VRIIAALVGIADSVNKAALVLWTLAYAAGLLSPLLEAPLRRPSRGGRADGGCAARTCCCGDAAACRGCGCSKDEPVSAAAALRCASGDQPGFEESVDFRLPPHVPMPASASLEVSWTSKDAVVLDRHPHERLEVFAVDKVPL